jgi:hypothetical protein
MASVPVFEPDDVNELLRGWLLHAHKGRDRHDLTARRYGYQQRYLLGIPATIISAIVGTTTFAALQESPNRAIQLLVGGLSVLGAILVSIQSFLDLGARAERHRIAGVRYKAAIRQLEQLGIGTISGLVLDAPAVTELRRQLDALEEEMPVVPPGVYDQIEAKYLNKVFVDSVLKQSRALRVSSQIEPQAV